MQSWNNMWNNCLISWNYGNKGAVARHKVAIKRKLKLQGVRCVILLDIKPYCKTHNFCCEINSQLQEKKSKLGVKWQLSDQVTFKRNSHIIGRYKNAIMRNKGDIK